VKERLALIDDHSGDFPFGWDGDADEWMERRRRLVGIEPDARLGHLVGG
jgi:hypothetical protein